MLLALKGVIRFTPGVNAGALRMNPGSRAGADGYGNFLPSPVNNSGAPRI
ncbi:hypothetical protein EDD90_7747 [Streptomyces sp. Ag109_O5-1]|nr:hypothetical protein EDD90_7747 [Streptomyces sp. Ag109_O5-1]